MEPAAISPHHVTLREPPQPKHTIQSMIVKVALAALSLFFGTGAIVFSAVGMPVVSATMLSISATCAAFLLKRPPM